MRKLLVGLVGLCLVGCVAATGFYYARTLERETLTVDSRAAAPGKFVGSSVGWTHYEVGGPDTGRVAVLVHGFSVPYYIWDSTFVALSNAGYRVIRYDLLGRGWSERADARYDGGTFDTQLGELLDSLKVAGPVDLFGLSFGGYVSAYFAAEHPQRVRTLVLVDPVVRASAATGVQSWPIVGRYLFETMAAPVAAKGQPGDFLHPEKFPGWEDRYLPQQRFKGFARALHRSRFEMSHEDFTDLHGRIAKNGTPVLLVWGKQDPTIPFDQSKDLLAHIPSAEFVPIDSSGHLPGLEQTALFNTSVLGFLARH